MDYQLSTRLNGNIVMTSRFHENKRLQRDKTSYRFLWVQGGSLVAGVDHILMRLTKDEIITLTPLHHLEVKKVEGEYLTLVFNSNFYYVFGHDDEVSYNGVLFYGSSRVMCLEFSGEQSSGLHGIVRGFCRESVISDSFQEEMLRVMLKHFIITCTRIARTKFNVGREHEKISSIIQQFYVLIDGNSRKKKQVRDYAGILCHSPKTLSNLSSVYRLPSPLRIIHERIEAEAKRLLLYARRNAKEIGDILGSENLAVSGHFFKKMMRGCVSECRGRTQWEESPTVTEQLPPHVPSETGVLAET